jgi:uncharacterized membrane protein YsdA (DUF1294 family)
MEILLVYLFTVNALGFVLMLIDKEKAKRNLWRIPEATLLTVAAIGGSLGTLIGMRIFRHKTLHLKFSLGVPVVLLAHILILIFLMTKTAMVA